MAQRKQQSPVLVREISRGLGLPYHFLNKVLQNLTREGIVVSHKGSKGGFTLGKPAGEIMLADIVRGVDGEQYIHSCVLGFPRCDSSSPCPVHDQWGGAREIIITMLNKKTIDELGETMFKKLHPTNVSSQKTKIAKTKRDS